MNRPGSAGRRFRNFPFCSRSSRLDSAVDPKLGWNFAFFSQSSLLGCGEQKTSFFWCRFLNAPHQSRPGSIGRDTAPKKNDGQSCKIDVKCCSEPTRADWEATPQIACFGHTKILKKTQVFEYGCESAGVDWERNVGEHFAISMVVFYNFLWFKCG